MEYVYHGCETEAKITVLAEERKMIAAHTAIYRFYACRISDVLYVAEVIYGGERSAAYLGEDPAFCEEVFTALVRGEVTPCTLRDIVEDIRNS